MAATSSPSPSKRFVVANRVFHDFVLVPVLYIRISIKQAPLRTGLAHWSFARMLFKLILLGAHVYLLILLTGWGMADARLAVTPTAESAPHFVAQGRLRDAA